MRAVRYHEAGPPEILQVDTVSQPTPQADEILVSVYAASINPTDSKRRGRGSGPFPKTTGSDFAGVVEEVGSEVSAFSPGDRVCGTGLHTKRFHQGSFAEYVSVPVDVVTLLPESVSFEDGAAIALVGVTAWQALIENGGLQPAETCLVHGGTGGVGHVLIQLASLLGAYTVTTVGSSTAEEVVIDLGADAAFRYDNPDLLEAVSDETGVGYDVVTDHRVHEYFDFDIEAAAFGGRIIHYGGSEAQVRYPRTGRGKDISIHMMSMSNLSRRDDTPQVSTYLQQILELVESGAVEPIIARTYDFEDAAEMHRAVVEDSFVGKLVATM